MGWDNIPVRSEKSLYDIAVWAAQDEELKAYLLSTPAESLTAQLDSPDSAPVPLFAEFAARFQAHLEQFGHIIFQLDFAADLPLDHPEPMLENIKMYLRGEGSNPHERQRASAQRRIQTSGAILSRLKGWRRWAFSKALRAGQAMAEVREDALAEIGLGYPALRSMLRELGRRFVAAGAIQQAEDIFWLEKAEIAALVDGDRTSRQAQVAERKEYWRRLKRETPPPMIPVRKRVMGVKTDIFVAHSQDGQAADVLKGVPTSGGKVTAPACVLHGPQDFDQMRPGDVLVAGATTPAWTPLFAMASAVVTDIGGPLSHGSIVAREYGIPAVMGTGVATRRIADGQTITVDGDAGTVTLLER
jgi:pyruvate,water dikinase